MLDASLNISNGGVTSTGGIVSLSGGGQLSGTGILDVSGSTWGLGGDFVKSSGTLTTSQTNLELADSITLTSDVALSFVTLNLNHKTLTLGSATSDLTVINPLHDTGTISTTTEGISTGGADLILNTFLIIDGEGSVTSTSGEVSLLAGGRLSGSGELDVSGSTLVLGGDFEKRPVVGSQLSGTLTISQTDLKLADNSTLTSDEALNFVNLNLNDYALTLGSSTSDLTVQNTITIDASTEGISTGGADLTLLASLNISNGSVTSTGGIISLHCSDICKDLGGGQLSGSGILDVSDSTWVLVGNFVKSGGFTIEWNTNYLPNTDLALGGNSTLTSDV